jgi:hypothetical protein
MGKAFADLRGSTPLHGAAKAGRLDIVEWLMHRGAARSLQVRTASGATPVMFAERGGHYAVVGFLNGTAASPRREVINKAPSKYEKQVLPPAPTMPEPETSSSSPRPAVEEWSTSSVPALLFPLYVMPITALLTMERFEPFETLHDQGTVVEYDPDSMQTVIFVSQCARPRSSDDGCWHAGHLLRALLACSCSCAQLAAVLESRQPMDQ